MKKRLLHYAPIYVMLALILATTLVLRAEITAKASDTAVFLCINDPPTIQNTCADSFNQSTRLVDNKYWCDLNIDSALSYTVSTSSVPDGMWVDINGDNLTFNASQDGVGNHNLLITATDESGCVNGADHYNYAFSVNDVNDPPLFIRPIPEVTFSKGTSISPYSLYDHFEDVDGDLLNFTVIGAHLVTFTFSSITGDVTMTSNECGTEYVLYRATDPYSLSDDSDPAEITVVCPDESGSNTGGGSSGSASTPPCQSQWKCDEWSECFINGTRSKRCIDLNGCRANDYIRFFWEECTYVPTCYDGVQNGDETGIDCGGSCKFCGTCFDGLLNQDEEAIDCGGTSCEACSNCTDGIQNWDETGIDCGGPICAPCVSCFDGVQNGDETGIDCGGSCSSCVLTEIPGIIEEVKGPISILAIILAVVGIALLVLFKFYRKQILSTLASLGWYLTRHHRKQILLTDTEKSELLRDLLHLDKTLKNNPTNDITPMVDHATDLGRRFFSYLFDVHFAFEEEDITRIMEKKIAQTTLRKVLGSFMVKQQLLEKVRPKLIALELRAFVEELRQLVIQTSNVTAHDLVHDASEIEVKGTPFEKALSRLYNAYLALQFEEVEPAKNYYMNLLALYDRLTPKQKEIIFLDVNRLYYEIKYLLSWIR